MLKRGGDGFCCCMRREFGLRYGLRFGLGDVHGALFLDMG